MRVGTSCFCVYAIALQATIQETTNQRWGCFPFVSQAQIGDVLKSDIFCRSTHTIVATYSLSFPRLDDTQRSWTYPQHQTLGGGAHFFWPACEGSLYDFSLWLSGLLLLAPDEAPQPTQ